MGTPERVAVAGAGVGGLAADLEFGARAAAVMADPDITAPCWRRLLAGATLGGTGDMTSFFAGDGRGFVERIPEPAGLPDWLSQDELDTYVAEFTRTGFTGGIDWYRNLDRNWELPPRLAGAKELRFRPALRRRGRVRGDRRAGDRRRRPAGHRRGGADGLPGAFAGLADPREYCTVLVVP